MNKEVIVQQGQSIIDICLQEYGTLDALLELHQLNSFTSIPQSINPGDVVLANSTSDTRNRKNLKLLGGKTIASWHNSLEPVSATVVGWIGTSIPEILVLNNTPLIIR